MVNSTLDMKDIKTIKTNAKKKCLSKFKQFCKELTYNADKAKENLIITTI